MRSPAKLSPKPKKAYTAPKLTTHGSVAKLTEHRFPIPITPGSGLSF